MTRSFSTASINNLVSPSFTGSSALSNFSNNNSRHGGVRFQYDLGDDHRCRFPSPGVPGRRAGCLFAAPPQTWHVSEGCLPCCSLRLRVKQSVVLRCWCARNMYVCAIHEARAHLGLVRWAHTIGILLCCKTLEFSTTTYVCVIGCTHRKKCRDKSLAPSNHYLLEL